MGSDCSKATADVASVVKLRSLGFENVCILSF